MASKPVFGFHFSQTKRLNHGDNRILEQGKTYTVDKTNANFIECGSALHGSSTPHDARWYVTAPKYLSLCIFHGAKAKPGYTNIGWGYKFAYERRTIIKLVKLSPENQYKLRDIFYTLGEDSVKKFNDLCYKLLKINPEDYK